MEYFFKNRCKLFTLLAALLCATTVLGQTNNYPFDLPGSGTSDNPYLIESEEHWNQLWRKVGNDQQPYADKYFKLTKDISVNRPLGLQENRFAFFSGHFDGDGHTLTVKITKKNVGISNPSNPHLAPFRCMRNGSIKNLHVTGTVDSPWKYAAGLVGLCCGNTVIENCRVSVKVTSTFQGDGKHGGLVAVHQKFRSTDDRLTIRGCVFDGMLIATESTGSCGFLGYDNMLEKGAIIEDCIFAPTEVSTQGENTFFDARPEAHPTLSNCYYTQPLGNVQGKALYSITAGNNTTVEKAGNPTASYGVSGITVYGENAGLKYLDGCYGGSKDAVALNLGGSDASVYRTTAGTISGDKNPYTLTMADADAVVTSMSFGDAVYYIERSWDENNKTVVETFRTLATGQYTELTGGDNISLKPGYYVVKGDVEYDVITMTGNGEHHLVLCDGATLKMLSIDVVTDNTVEGENSLHIYGQINDSGKLQSKTRFLATYHAAIGGSKALTNGPIIIHGGNIDVIGDHAAAGIGGGDNGNGGIVTIYGGNVRAYGGGGGTKTPPGSAGIGGGNLGNGGTVTIYGGHIYAQAGGEGGGAGIGGGKHRPGGTITICGGYVEAHGNDAESITLKGEGGAGIGGGSNSAGGTINISGGKVYAYGDNDAAGIGGGENGNGGNVTISGGYVEAHGGGNGAGIGSGGEDLTEFGCHGGSLTVTGGEVYAYGGVDAAGIGGGEDADGATVTISGGYVYAEGKDDGAGIGGGQSGDGGKVTITGGTVEAKAGRQDEPDKGYRAIGAGHGLIGKGSDNNGSLTFADNLGVFITNNLYRSVKANRVSDCRNYHYVKITKCAHGGATVSIVSGEKHDVSSCKYCLVTGKEAHTFGDDGQCNICKLIRLEDGGDNSAVFSAWTDDQPHTFVLSGRKLAAAQDEDGNWSNRAYTICVPFDMDLAPYMDSLKLYTLSYIRDDKEMVFTENVPYLFAGKPYLIVMRQGELELLSRDVMLTDTPSEEPVLDWDDHDREMGWWRGTFTKIDNTEATWEMAYALQSAGDFRRITTDIPEAVWKGFRAMFCPNVLPDTDKYTILKGVLFPGGGGDEYEDYTTSFDPTLFMGDADIPDSTTGIKTMSDGRSKMEDVWHTIDGRKLQGKPTQKGVYINKGRKVVIK